MKPQGLLKDLMFIAPGEVLLSLIFAPFDMSFLAWVAYVPIIAGFMYTKSPKRYYLLTYIAAACYWLYNIYWLINIVAVGWIGASLVMALFQPLLIFAISQCLKRNRPLWLSCAVIITGIEMIYSLPFGGFNWHLLGHSMYKNLPLIQIADITGVAGISFIAAMTNGLVCDCLRIKKIRNIAISAVICASLIAAVLAYGYYRLNTDSHLQTGPLIGLIQTNVPSEMKEDPMEGENILKTLFSQSEQCLQSGAGLLVWPETIISHAINRDFLIYSRQDSEPWQYHQRISEFVKDKTHLIAGGTALKVGNAGGELKITDQYNSAYLYKNDGSQHEKRYDKIHLVPFGEYIPPQNVQWIKNIFMAFTPYNYDYTLTAGTEPVRFDIELERQRWNFAVMICYEDTDADLNAKLIYSPEQGKAGWLLNISNDGWYVWNKDGKITPSIELAQRTAISVFRAVENRVAVMRSVNTGISCVIEPCGRIKDGYQYGTLPKEAFKRQAVEGWLAERPVIDKRITFFTKHGTVFSKLCGAAFLLMLVCPNLGGKKHHHEALSAVKPQPNYIEI